MSHSLEIEQQYSFFFLHILASVAYSEFIERAINLDFVFKSRCVSESVSQ